MGELYALIEKYFTDEEWYFVPLTERSILQMNNNGSNGKWTCFAQVNEEQHIFFFFSICPVITPPEKRLIVAEFLTRANYGLKIGNFELDFNDGEIRYKTSIDVEGSELTPALISNLVRTNLWTMDRYLSGIFAVIFGDTTPLKAIQDIEGE